MLHTLFLAQRALPAAVLMTACALAQAQSTVIDFDPVTPPVDVPIYDEDGFRLSVSMGELRLSDAFTPGNTGVQPSFGYTAASFLTVQAIDGSLFDAQSVDLVEATVFPQAYSLEAIGHRPDGSTASQYFTLDGLAGAETMAFNSDFSGLSRLEFRESTSNSFSVEAVLLDNITLMAAPVPEPGQAALLLAGLGALGWALRRRS